MFNGHAIDLKLNGRGSRMVSSLDDPTRKTKSKKKKQFIEKTLILNFKKTAKN